jgi:hypothetical protein
MSSETRKAELYLNGVHVGIVVASGATDSWGYGEFTPVDAFMQFAPLFGAWSLLVHEEDGQSRAPREALDELRDAEMAMDSLHVELRWLDPTEHVEVRQVSIDGPLIEWRQ